MLNNDAQVIFLLTYKHSQSEWRPLNAQEYSQVAYRIREKGLSGPNDLQNMNLDEITKNLNIEDSIAKRIRNLLDLGGSASLYIERLFNQGVTLITRTDSLYPGKFKTLLRDNTPPFLCIVGKIQLLSDYRDPCIISASDISKLTAAKITDRFENQICLINSSHFIKQLADWSRSWERSIIVSSIGLSKLIRHPGIRELIQKGNTLIMSTNTIEDSEQNYHDQYLYLMAFAISSGGNLVYFQQNKRVVQMLDHIRGLVYLKSRLAFDEQFSREKGTKIISFSQIEREQQSNLIEEKHVNSQYPIYTIGHSNHEITKLLELLESHEIDLLVDIRSAPSSKYAPQFNQQSLKKSLKEVGIQYKYLGSSLGGRPEDKDVLNSEGKIIREYIEQKDWYQKGIHELIETAMTGKRIALMCSEENPAHCHRGYIVSNTLIERGIQILHIRENGEAQYLGLLNSPTDQMEIPL